MKLIWTDPSIEDLRSIRDYIARGADYYAANFVEQVILSVERLLRFPKLGRVVPEARDENIRELVYQNYRIIYRIAGERIEILTVVHGSRDLTQRRTPPWEIG
jgi:plasmid stabilization system protein ParE